MKKIIILGLVLLLNSAFARDNIIELFKNNEAIIYTLNIRSFASIDKNLDGIIDINQGDIKGTFLNAKEKLPELAHDGINTIYLLPITPTGKLKALGTRGSLYAMNAFNEINPELDDLENPLSVEQEAGEFVQKAHELNMNVIVDLPGCGSYDLTIKKPDWFKKDEKGEALVVADWTDVRLFDVNQELISNTKKFVDMVQNLGFDGIRADVASIKPPEFWAEIISYAREKNPNFLFLAEANPDWTNPATVGVNHYSTIDELLHAGFNSYYGFWSDFKGIKSASVLNNKITVNQKILKRNNNSSIVSTLATHDQQAPILRGKNYWNMVLWLSVLYPQNTYFLDGFSVGDDFIYPYENKPSTDSLTDYDNFYVHNGQYDIFNLTASVRAKHPKFKQEYLKAIKFKQKYKNLITKGEFKLIKTNNDKIFAYLIKDNNKELIVLGNLDEKDYQTTKIKSKNLKNQYTLSIVTSKNHPEIKKDVMSTRLEPLELQAYLIEKR